MIKTSYKQYTLEDFKRVTDIDEMNRILADYQSRPDSIYFLDGDSDGAVETDDKGQETSASLRRRWRKACADLRLI